MPQRAVTPTEGTALPRPQLDRGIFLIANKGLKDPNFNRSVILITQYDPTGTIGLVINRPLQMPASEVLPPLQNLGLDTGNLHVGGPVAVNSLQLLIRSPSNLDDSLKVFDDVYLINESAVLTQLLNGGIPSSALRLYAGYAGWAAGQLESELLRGDWYLWRADSGDIFITPPDTVWPKLIDLAAAQWVRLPYPASTLTQSTGGSIMISYRSSHPRSQLTGTRARPLAGPSQNINRCAQAGTIDNPDGARYSC